MKTKVTSKLIMFSFLTMAYSSCKKNSLENKLPDLIAKEYKLEINQIPQHNGVLHFENYDHFYQAALYNFKKEKKMIPKTASQNLDQAGFISMQNAFDEIIADEDIIESNLEISGETDPNVYDNTHSNLITGQYYKTSRIRESADGGLFLDINTGSAEYATVLDPEGCVEIDNTLCQFLFDTVRIMQNASISQKSILLSTTSTNTATNIVVYTTPIGSSIAAKGYAEDPSKTWRIAGQKTLGKKRLIAYQDFITQIYDASGIQIVYSPMHIITVRALKRRLFGIWWNNDYANLQGNVGCNGNTTTGTIGFGTNLSSVSINWANSSSLPFLMPNYHTLTSYVEGCDDGYNRHRTTDVASIRGSTYVAKGTFDNGTTISITLTK